MNELLCRFIIQLYDAALPLGAARGMMRRFCTACGVWGFPACTPEMF